MTKKLLWLFVSVCALLLQACEFVQSNQNHVGPGSKDEPFLIGSFSDFIKIGESKKLYYYEFTNDIYFDESVLEPNCGFVVDESEKWIPTKVCYIIKNFYGHLDAKGYALKGIDLSDAHQNYRDLSARSHQQSIGIFDLIQSGSTVKNLVIDNMSIRSSTKRDSYYELQNTTKSKLGLLAGAVYGTQHDETYIENIHATGTIVYQGNYTHIGGLIGEVSGNVYIAESSTNTNINIIGSMNKIGGFAGYILGAQIEKSHATSDIITDGNGYVGGFSGDINLSSNVKESFSDSAIQLSGEFYSGGFSGLIGANNTGSPSSVEDSFSVGFIKSNTNKSTIGGFVGQILGDSFIRNTYNLVTLHVPGSYGNQIHGISGKQSNDKSSRQSYFIPEVAGTNKGSSYGNIEYYTASLTMLNLRESAIPFFSESIWDMENQDIPLLKHVDKAPRGARSNPLVVASIVDFQRLELRNWAHYEQKNHIDFHLFEQKMQFSLTQPFVGVYDGKGYKLSRIVISNLSRSPIEEALNTDFALFHKISYAHIKNVKIDQARIDNKVYLGNTAFSAVLAVRIEHSTIERLEINGTVSIETNSGSLYTGGIAAILSHGNTIKHVALTLEFSNNQTTNNASIAQNIHLGNVAGAVLGNENSFELIVIKSSSSIISPRTDFSTVNLFVGYTYFYIITANQLYYLECNHFENIDSHLFSYTEEISNQDIAIKTGGLMYVDQVIKIGD
jgi:hypothetical protein